MHSSRMRTGRTLTVFRGRTPPPTRQTPPPADTPPPLADTPPPLADIPPPLADTPPPLADTPSRQTPPPPVNRITHTCKNITLAKTSFRPVMNVLPCKNAKIKIVQACPYAMLNPFDNVNVIFLFWLHQYFSPTLFSDWNAMRICVIVNTTLWEP